LVVELPGGDPPDEFQRLLKGAPRERDALHLLPRALLHDGVLLRAAASEGVVEVQVTLVAEARTPGPRVPGEEFRKFLGAVDVFHGPRTILV